MLSKMKFKIKLTGSKCNEYPYLTILHNQQVLYSGSIINSTILEFDIELQETNLITFQGINKSQGENNKWDTQLNDSGQIIADKSLLINNIWFDNISMELEWIRSLTLVTKTGKEPFSANGWWDNGTINFSIQVPLLDWIIQEKFINVEQNVVAPHDARSGDQRFDYNYIREKIKLIRKIMND
jgi:hypothetical protein